ncbi:MAG: hypothetical protein ACM3PE_08170 [Deltaproteobacteria bacterium]
MKNRNIKRFTYVVLLILLFISISGCSRSNDSYINKEVNPQIDVYGVKLMMDESKVKSLLGSPGEKAMCVYGYEYEYTDKDINIGYDSKSNQVRRITSKNPETSIYGIKPGAELAEAYQVLAANGFKESADSKYKYSKESIILSIISMKSTNADGITIEIKPEQ